VKLDIDDLAFDYSDHPVVSGIDLTVTDGEILGLVGPNGAGKSTLIKCINHVLAPDVGRVVVDGTDVGSLTRNDVAKIMGYVAQKDSGNYSATVFDTVLMGRKPYINWRPSSKDLETVSVILEKLDLTDLSLRDVNNLSGGQQQKVMVGRALAQDPTLLLLDEPTSDLDIRHQLEVMDVIREEVDGGLAAVLAIHDLNLAARYCDTVAMLKDGGIYTTGRAEDVFTSENIEAVFRVTASTQLHDGRRVIIPEEPSSDGTEATGTGSTEPSASAGSDPSEATDSAAETSTTDTD
jgi:iron complex transport system ATP-binding protein